MKYLLVLLLFICSCTPRILTTIVYRNVGPTVPIYIDKPIYILGPIIYRDTCLTNNR